MQLQSSSDGDDSNLEAINLTIMILTPISIVILLFVGYKYEVYRNYSSMMIITLMTIYQIDQLIMAILRHNEVFEDGNRETDQVRFIDNTCTSFVTNSVNTLFLLQWRQAYMLLVDPEQEKEQLINTLFRNNMYLLVTILLLMIYCITVALLGPSDGIQSEEGSTIYVLYIIAYGILITLRAIIVAGYIWLFTRL